MKLTRKHELALIDIGLEALLNKTLKTSKAVPKKLHWTQEPKNRTKVRKTMKKLWEARQNNNK